MTEGSRIDDCLAVHDGHLFVEGCDTVDLVKAFNTPLYVMSENHLRRNTRRIVQAFVSRWPEGEVRVLPSIKANFTLAVRAVLTSEGLGCDTFGRGELEAALRTGVDPMLISVNGTAKDEHLLTRAIAVGARITLDSVREIDLVRDIARGMRRRAVVRFRLRPDYAELERASEFVEEDVTIRSFSSTYKPGIPTPDLLEAGPAALAADELDVRGVMAHLGRHHHDPEVWRGMVRGVVARLAELSKAWDGWTPGEIDLGGGFPSPRDPTGRALRRGADRPDRVAPIEDFAEVVTTSLREELAVVGIDATGIALEVEPGRAIHADAGVMLARVVNVKYEPGRTPERWLETDTTEMFLADLMLEHDVFPIVAASRMDATDTETVDVMGVSCGFDVLGSSVELPPAEPGDVLAFLDTGAYQDATSSNFNAMSRPATVLVCDDSAELVKRRESPDEIFARDVIPARLMPEENR